MTDIADRLREAATVLRERAKGATPGPWYWEEPSKEKYPEADQSLRSSAVKFTGSGGREYDEIVLTGWGYDASGIEGSDENRAYIATVHPGVGLALADWLDGQADTTCDCGVDEFAATVADLILAGD